jgi:transposase
MTVNHYIGFDVHKKSISYCVKASDGQILEEGKLIATRGWLRLWARQRTQPWRGAMEATLFSGWIYDTLKPYAAELQMGHPAMMKAIGASKKKNDRLDARKIADLVRCDLLPACYVAPVEIREMRRMLRYRNLVVGQVARLKNKMGGLLMEVGAPYNKEQLHGKKYFDELLGNLEEVPESVKDLMRLTGARWRCSRRYNSNYCENCTKTHG